MRLFVCTWLSADNQAFYARQMTELIESSSDMLRAIPRDSAHITYAFLPRADDRVCEETQRAVTDVAARHAAIDIRLGPPSILYARAEARLVYAPIVEVGQRDTPTRLGSDIVGELRRRLPDVEVTGSHSPHVTLARFRKHTRRGSARPVSDALGVSAVSGERTDRVAEIQVVSSELTTTGPRYVTLCWMRLGRRV